MKLAEKSKHADPGIETALQMVDEEMRKIVADIDAHRPVRPTGKPRGPRGPHARAAHAKAA